MNTEPELGTTLAGYRVDELIGRGGMSRVYRAWHVRLGRSVAFKVIAPELAADESVRERFVRESRMAARIDHPNIVPIYDCGEVDGLLYIAMRFVEGMDLAALLRRDGALPPRRALRLLDQVARALDAAHATGLVHRDVKPGNILVVPGQGPDEEEHVYLADFGLTKRTATRMGLTSTSLFVGTPGYAAPEQIEGRPVEARTDVYALGCVLYETLTGCVPFGDVDSDWALLYAHLKRTPPAPSAARSSLPVALDRVVARAMAKTPDARYSSCRELMAAARAACDGRVATETPAGEPTVISAGATGAETAVGAETVGAETAGGTETVGAETAGGTETVGGAEAVTGAETVGAPVVPEPRPSAAAAAPAGPDAGAERTGLPPSRERGRARRRTALIAAAAGVAGVALVAVLLSGVLGSGSSPTKDGRRATDGARARAPAPSRPHAVATIRVGADPRGIAVGNGSVWVANSGAGSVTRIASSTNRVTGAPIEVGAEPRRVAADRRGIWVSNEGSGTITRIDPRSGSPDPPIPVGGTPRALATGAGAVWVADFGDGVVRRVEQASGRVGPPVAVGPSPVSIAFGAGGVWVAVHDEGRVVRLDPRTGAVAGPGLRVADTIDGVAVGGDELWVAALRPGAVFRIGLKGGPHVIGRIPVGGGPLGVAVGAGAVWVPNSLGGTLTRIDPASNRVSGPPIKVGAEPRGVAIGAGAVWVTSSGAGAVTRVAP